MRHFNEVLNVVAHDHFDMTVMINKWKELLADKPADVEFRFFDNTTRIVPNFSKLISGGLSTNFLLLCGGQMDDTAHIGFYKKPLMSGNYYVPFEKNTLMSDGMTTIHGNSYTEVKAGSVKTTSDNFDTFVNIAQNQLIFHGNITITCGGIDRVTPCDIGLTPYVALCGTAHLCASYRFGGGEWIPTGQSVDMGRITLPAL